MGVAAEEELSLLHSSTCNFLQAHWQGPNTMSTVGPVNYHLQHPGKLATNLTCHRRIRYMPLGPINDLTYKNRYQPSWGGIQDITNGLCLTSLL